ncbi:class I SAM-dependent methyltransferase [Crocinitomicaceae bacterium]|nr:class I SAM-dependent methyltransferase [Crocinitomicaceae bacterium]
MRKYSFKDIDLCEMCGSKSNQHIVLGMRLDKSQGINPKKKTGIAVGVKKCSNCKLVFASPQPIPYDIQDHYGTPPEDYWKSEYFKWTPNYFKTQIEFAKERISFLPGMKALDIGAGLGKAMLSLEHYGFEAYGLEPSIPFHERAVNKMGISSERLKLGSVEDLEYEENYFDFITFGAVVEHLYSPKFCIERALQWLKPGGLMQIEVPSSKWLISKYVNSYFRFKGTNYVTNLSPMHGPYHLYEFDLRSFQELGKKIGFSIEHYEFSVCEIYFIPKFLHSIFRWYMKKTNTGMQLTLYLKKK